uniref:Uncharacterized protein n=1 Tax=Arundo donax TaxID=35708 RepID=A0A0A9C3X1_ARUDO
MQNVCCIRLCYLQTATHKAVNNVSRSSLSYDHTL